MEQDAVEFYYRRQESTWLFMTLAVPAQILFAICLFQPWPNFLWFLVAAVLLALAAWTFSSLTVKVGPRELVWYFGPGFWKYRLQLADIRSAEPVENRGWYGWGIRRVPGCWLYNVAGLSAVEIERRDQSKIRIGTDEPDRLVGAIGEASG